MKNFLLRFNTTQVILPSLMLLFFSLWQAPKVEAQVRDPLTLKIALSNPSPKVGETVDLVITATIPEEFYVYSNDFDPNLGPLLTELIVDEIKGGKLEGSLKSIGAKKKFDEVWGGNVSIFTKKLEFHQKIRITEEKINLRGILSYQMCKNDICVPLESDLKYSFTALPADNSTKTPEESTAATVPGKGTDSADSPAVTSPATVDTAGKTTGPTTVTASDEDDDIRKKSLLALFLLGFAAGFLAVLTPCVFPMLPMTVAFFTKRQEKGAGRKMALFYGFSIIVIYVGIGLLLSALFGATFGYTISTHWFPNLLFFVIFMIFGASFLGAFELVLPSSFVNKIDRNSDRGGYIGVFFIALTLVVISFSCTVPIVGSVAILAENGELVRPLVALLGFAISFALPFTLFAFFPQWMKKLPKSGGWLNSIKVVFGFLEVALALKFFSQADLAYHWGILDRDVFLAIWIVLSLLLGFYFLGKLRFHHDDEVAHVSVGRFFLALTVFSFGVYMIPGLWGAPLKPLAGILPPLSAQDYVLAKGGESTQPEKTEGDTIRYADILHLPYGLKGFYHYEQGLAAVKTLGKPAFLDFTGHSCANCRKMEENVWPDPQVMKRLKEDVIIVSLYADEKTKLPEEEQYVSERDGRKKTTIGQRNLDLEISRYGENAQPMYFIVDEKGNVLSKFNGYKNDAKAFADFIDKGVAAFKAQKK